MTDPMAALAAVFNNSPIGQNARRAMGNNPGRGGGIGGGGGRNVGGRNAGPPPPVTKTRVLEECGQTLATLWEQSRPHALPLALPQLRGLGIPGGNPQTPKNEQGCWIFYNTVTGALRVQTWTNPSTRDSCTPTAPAAGQNERLVVDFHTHPNVGQEGYNPNPSGPDIAAVGNAVTGLVRADDGWHWFGLNIPD